MSTRLDDAVARAVKRVARTGDPYFTRTEVLTATLRQHGISEAIVRIRHDYRALGLDDAILRHIDTQISRVLRERDAHGIRLFECYAVGNGERRWRRFTGMTTDDLDAVLRDLKVLAGELERKIGLYETIRDAMRAHGPSARVRDVYESVVDGVALPDEGTEAA